MKNILFFCCILGAFLLSTSCQKKETPVTCDAPIQQGLLTNKIKGMSLVAPA